MCIRDSDAIADDYTRSLAELSPVTATYLGIKGYDHLMGDYSPDASAAYADLNRATLAKLDAAVPADETDRVTVAAMRDRLALDVEPVSYTHLDVYKRQTVLSPSRIRVNHVIGSTSGAWPRRYPLPRSASNFDAAELRTDCRRPGAGEQHQPRPCPARSLIPYCDGHIPEHPDPRRSVMTNPGPDGWHGPLPDIEIPDVSLYDLLFAGLTSADAAKPAVVDHASGVTLTLGEVKHQTCLLYTSRCV